MCVGTKSAGAPDVLLIRGLGREVGHWLTFPAELERRLGSRVFALDNPGVGAERHRKAPWTIPETCEDVLGRFREARSAEGRSCPFIVVGVSLGGMMALDLASRNTPGLLGGVVMNASTPSSRVWRRFRPAPFFSMLGALLQPSRVARERIMIPYTINDSVKRERSAAVREDIALKRPVSGRSFFAQLTAAAVWRAPAHCDVPLLVLASDDDRLVHPACSTVLAQRYGAPLHCHPTAGHDITSDDGEWVTERIIEWLNTVVQKPLTA